MKPNLLDNQQCKWNINGQPIQKIVSCRVFKIGLNQPVRDVLNSIGSKPI